MPGTLTKRLDFYKILNSGTCYTAEGHTEYTIQNTAIGAGGYIGIATSDPHPPYDQCPDYLQQGKETTGNSWGEKTKAGTNRENESLWREIHHYGWQVEEKRVLWCGRTVAKGQVPSVLAEEGKGKNTPGERKQKQDQVGKLVSVAGYPSLRVAGGGKTEEGKREKYSWERKQKQEQIGKMSLCGGNPSLRVTGGGKASVMLWKKRWPRAKFLRFWVR
ncbi:hypothetical protein CEXT_204721 [Caerostris extrusa]|uniref:Uncharacterized protein n=1 Tax=Caerostris extrusa TaxID=172846 RepID=A0AAV4MUW7_CAEEX|nr:hypothetical protein CEXT_204721 [Caerostris extrusa]